MNEDIRFKEVRCNADDGSSHGIISSREAQELADEAGLDLVCIAPNANPPVVKIMDYGKFKYQQEKKKKTVAPHKNSLAAPARRLAKTQSVAHKNRLVALAHRITH